MPSPSGSHSAGTVPKEEVRFAVVLNGGVSLAVWMGGACHELNRVTRTAAFPEANPFAPIMELLSLTAKVDVIAGASAGGINGAALALAQTNVHADLTCLRAVWSDQGRMESLLREPFVGNPSSLLRGDYFHEQLHRVMGDLADHFEDGPRDRIDLTLTTTLLTGVQDVTVDALGERIPDVRHSGLFRFTEDCFVAERITETAAALALASRSSASFPFAFEPSFVPVSGTPAPASPCELCEHHGSPADRDPVPPSISTGDPLRPDMTPYADWTGDPQAGAGDRSRYATDGGVLSNTPTQAALDAIDRMPADGPIRRVMLLVFPHAPAVQLDVADTAKAPPNIMGTAGGLAEALRSQGGRTFVEQVDARNRAAAGWRDGRTAVLRLLAEDENRSLIETIWPLYRDLRLRQEAYDWAERAPKPQRWPVERTRLAAEAAQRAWMENNDLPYLPRTCTAVGPGWRWGVTVALGIADAAADMLRRAMSQARPDQVEELRTARQKVSSARSALVCWQGQIRATLSPTTPAGTGAPDPDQEYWHERLTCYRDRVKNGLPGRQIRCRIDGIVASLVDVHVTVRAVPTKDRAFDALFPPEQLTADELLFRLIELEIATAVVADQRRPGGTAPIDLVQLSMNAQNPFATRTMTGDDKLAGLSLGRFGGFLKRSWRVNDWIWGRMDAATVLTRIVLAPTRIRRVLDGTDAADAITTIARQLYGAEVEVLPEPLRTFADEARAALERLLTDERADDVTALADFCATGLHLDIIREEFPHLVAAIEADAVEGAGPRSGGQIFLAENKELITTIGSASKDVTGRLVDGYAALLAFDRAGIGRETVQEEVGSDQLIRTAVTAVAVGATVLDSERFGTAVAKPMTKLVRGALLLPFWVTVGLTRGGRTARFLAMLALVVGGVLLSLSLLDVLPGALAAPGALVGLSSLLFGFGYAALRTGTLLHGVLLLAPVGPLLAIAIQRVVSAETTSSDTLLGVSTVVLVCGVCVALVLLGSVPTPMRSPVAAALAVGRRVGTGSTELPVVQLCFRWAAWALLVLVVAVLVAAGTRITGPMIAGAVPAWLRREPVWPVWLVSVGVVCLVSAVVAVRAGRWLQTWIRVDGPTPGWRLLPVSHPAGVSAGWSVVYGVVYVGLAWLGQVWSDSQSAAADVARTALRDAPSGPADVEMQRPALEAAVTEADALAAAFDGLTIGAGVIALSLFAVGPILFPARARRALTRSLASDRTLVDLLQMHEGQEAANALIEALRQRGATYRYLIERGRRKRPTLLPSAAGCDLEAALRSGRRSPWSSVPVSVHAVVGLVAVAATMAAALWWSPWVPWLTTVVGLLVTSALAAVWLVGLGVLEGRALQAASDVERLWEGSAPALLSVVGLLGAAAVTTHWPTVQPSPEIQAVVGAFVVAVIAALQLLLVLYWRRFFARRVVERRRGQWEEGRPVTVELARLVARHVAPDEVDTLDEAAQRYFDDPEAELRAQPPGSPSPAGPKLPSVLAAAHAALPVLRAARRVEAQGATDTQVAELLRHAPDASSGPTVLTAGQAAAVGRAVAARCLAAKLPKADGDRLTRAVIESLNVETSPDEGAPRGG